MTSRQRGLAHVFFRRAAALRRVQGAVRPLCSVIDAHLVSNYVGPKRYTRLPCRIEDVPEVDVVAISVSSSLLD